MSASSAAVTLPFAFFRAQFHLRDDAAQILIALTRLHEQRIAPAFGRSHFRADVRPNAGFLRRLIKTRRAIHAVSIHHRHRAHAVFGAQLRQFLRQRRAFQKTERRSRMQFGVHQS